MPSRAWEAHTVHTRCCAERQQDGGFLGMGGGGILHGVRFVFAGDFYQHLVEAFYKRVAGRPRCAAASRTTRRALGAAFLGAVQR